MAHISFISCRLSTYPEDSITVGMIFIDDEGKSSLRISENKMKIIKKILKKNTFSLFKSVVDAMVNRHQEFNLEIIDYLNKHQNGLMKVYPATKIALEHVEDKENFFDNYFNKRVDKY
jgi:hypothetical protein